ncbi:MAG: bifunctional methylenetetrahydrofolate dehydrogenase/methenyltetrahydrofolate cyclohydrolase FolD [Acidobacteriota bacterium]|nr:bifunctional methylenetetrahydrofolate dehydrogenase/methenyltetrahydrofolate cyclohydrolase FolD [Blastocatellia bacterium]MDW8411520.1 bifunctional methylenetetrahydrofolate dehydrogenase/methenyltetrahydrofolate cyclohydrolase FolD [Acidobacteriota bacterium]
MAVLLDGNRIASEIRSELVLEVAELVKKGVRPGLAAILVGDDPASKVYVASKTKTCEALGIYSETHHLSAFTTASELLELIARLNDSEEIDGILVQMPLPPQINADEILQAVSPQKDVDGFHPENVGRLALKQPRFIPCTPAGIMELLKRSGIAVSEKRAVVLGRSRIVGLPLSLLLLHANATVTICHSRTPALADICRQADLLVAAIGKPAFVTEELIKPGAVVIDVGINRLSDRQQVMKFFADDDRRLDGFDKRGFTLIGDVDPRGVAAASAYTPVPGGVGPLTIAMLMKNTVLSAQRRIKDKYSLLAST